jgi:hypothetical protein
VLVSVEKEVSFRIKMFVLEQFSARQTIYRMRKWKGALL